MAIYTVHLLFYLKWVGEGEEESIRAAEYFIKHQQLTSRTEFGIYFEF
jgi:hypothetical protein